MSFLIFLSVFAVFAVVMHIAFLINPGSQSLGSFGHDRLRIHLYSKTK